MILRERREANGFTVVAASLANPASTDAGWDELAALYPGRHILASRTWGPYDLATGEGLDGRYYVTCEVAPIR